MGAGMKYGDIDSTKVPKLLSLDRKKQIILIITHIRLCSGFVCIPINIIRKLHSTPDDLVGE